MYIKNNQSLCCKHIKISLAYNKQKQMKYWNLNFLNDSEQVNISMVKMNKGIVNINLHTHSCNNRKFPRLKTNGIYWINDSGISFLTSYIKIKVVHIRSGVIFYIKYNSKLNEFKSKELHFETGSIIHLHAEPEFINVNLNPKYYKVNTLGNKSIINYQFTGY